MSEIVDIEIKPWSKLIVHEVVKSTVEILVKMQAMFIESSQEIIPLMWAGGIVFHHGSFPESSETVREMLQGRLHWMAVEYAPLKKYTPMLKYKDTNREVPIVDVSYNPIFRKLAKQLLTNEK
ncbi:MAG: hypothetical protein ABIH76_02385 [Candidatus Bathyarchaeota archaeon]